MVYNGPRSGQDLPPGWAPLDDATLQARPEAASPQALPMGARPPGGSGSRAALAFIGVLALIIVVLVALMFLVLPVRKSSTDASADHAVHTSATTTEPAADVAGIDGGPGPIAGRNFSVGDNPYTIGAGQLPFAFAFPAGWSCIYSTASTIQTTGGYTCYQDNINNGGGPSRAGGRIGYQRCASRCTQAEIDEVGRKMRIDDGDWRRIDSSTTFGEHRGILNGEQKVRVGMRRVYARGSAPDTIAFAVLTGDPGFRDTMLKVLNSVRANTP